MPDTRVLSRVALSAAIAMSAAPAAGQERVSPATNAPTTLQGLAEEKQNPFTEATEVPIEFATGFGVGPGRDVGEQITIQPRIPLELGRDWRLIVRPALPLTYLPGPPKNVGLGDLQPSFFLTPARTGRWAWGVGPALQLPTATHEELGTGMWSAGPTAALFYTEGPWLAGVLATQLWSFAGPHRASVNQTSVEPNVSYNFESGWYVQFDPVVTRDWTAASADAWTVPLGLDVGKVAKLGERSVAFQLGAYSFALRPTGSARWVLRAQISFQEGGGAD
jgi:hypothetical protein